MERSRRVGVPKRRWQIDGLGGSARNAIEKSRVEEGEDGVTMMAGKGDFSVTRGKDKSIFYGDAMLTSFIEEGFELDTYRGVQE